MACAVGVGEEGKVMVVWTNVARGGVWLFEADPAGEVGDEGGGLGSLGLCGVGLSRR